MSLHGEVQKEVLAALLDERYGVAVRFLATSTVCLERVVGAGASPTASRPAATPTSPGSGCGSRSRRWGTASNSRQA